jgi:hypothetical protein
MQVISLEKAEAGMIGSPELQGELQCALVRGCLLVFANRV